jgi:hypothetical protein
MFVSNRLLGCRKPMYFAVVQDFLKNPVPALAPFVTKQK